MKRNLLLAAAVLSAGLLLAGCSKKTDTKLESATIEIWHTYNGAQKECLEKIAEDFNNSQSIYTVKILAQDYQGFADTVYNAVANKVGPSIIFNYSTTAMDYIEEGLAVDISKYIEEDVKNGDKSMKNVIDSLPKSMDSDVHGFEDGGIYYLPGATTGPVFFYNKTLFDELGLNPPKDWKDLENISKTIYEKKGIPGFYSDGLVDNLQMMIMQNGLGYIDMKTKKVTFCTDKFAEIYQWYADCCKKGYFEFNTVGKYASEDLATGAVASFSGSCVNDQYIEMLNGAELGMAPIIAKSNGRSFYTGWNRGPIFLKRSDAVDRGAYEFTKFFLQPENNAKWVIANSAVSPYGTTEKTEIYKNYINNLPSTSALPYVQQNLSVSGSFPTISGSAQIRNLIVEYLNYTVSGKMTAKEAVSQLEKACNEALNS